MISDNKQIRWINVLKFAGAFIAFLVGAGFATGQEVFQYFAAHGYQGFLVGLFVFVCFVYVGRDFMVSGFNERFRKPNDIYRYYCGKYIGIFYDYFSILFIYMSFIVMLGGAGATVEQYYHLSPTIGTIAMATLAVITAIFGLGRIVNIIGSIAPLIVIFVVIVGIGAIVINHGGIAEGAQFVAVHKEIKKVGSNWFYAALSYVGFCMLWLATFLSAMGTEANSKKEASLGTTLGALGFVLGALILMLGLLTSIPDLYKSDIPSLIIAAKIWPPLAAVFSVIILAGIYTTAVPLLWSVSARFTRDNTWQSKLVLVVLAIVGSFIAIGLPFQDLVNKIYGINGYVGIILIFFMLAKGLGITERFFGNAKK